MNWLRGRHQEPDGGLVLHDCNTRIENLRINDPRWRYSTAAVRQQRPLVDAFPERTTTLAGSATLPRSIAQAIAFERGRGSAVQLTDEGTQPGLSQGGLVACRPGDRPASLAAAAAGDDRNGLGHCPPGDLAANRGGAGGQPVRGGSSGRPSMLTSRIRDAERSVVSVGDPVGQFGYRSCCTRARSLHCVENACRLLSASGGASPGRVTVGVLLLVLGRIRRRRGGAGHRGRRRARAGRPRRPRPRVTRRLGPVRGGLHRAAVSPRRLRSWDSRGDRSPPVPHQQSEDSSLPLVHSGGRGRVRTCDRSGVSRVLSR